MMERRGNSVSGFILVKEIRDESLEFERGSEFFEFGRWLISYGI